MQKLFPKLNIREGPVGGTKGLQPAFLMSSAGVKLSKRLILNPWSWYSLATSQNRNVKGFLFASISPPSPGSPGRVTTNKEGVEAVQGQLTLTSLAAGYQRDGLYSTSLGKALLHGLGQFPYLSFWQKPVRKEVAAEISLPGDVDFLWTSSPSFTLKDSLCLVSSDLYTDFFLIPRITFIFFFSFTQLFR